MTNDTPGAELGREIRRRREARGLILEQLAERAQLNSNYIGSLEIGKRDPSLSTVVALAKGLGVAPGEFFGGVPNVGPEAEEAARLFDAAPSEVQKTLLALLRASARMSRR